MYSSDASKCSARSSWAVSWDLSLAHLVYCAIWGKVMSILHHFLMHSKTLLKETCWAMALGALCCNIPYKIGSIARGGAGCDMILGYSINERLHHHQCSKGLWILKFTWTRMCHVLYIWCHRANGYIITHSCTLLSLLLAQIGEPGRGFLCSLQSRWGNLGGAGRFWRNEQWLGNDLWELGCMGRVEEWLGILWAGSGKVWGRFGECSRDALGRPVDALGCIIITHDGWIIITTLARCVFTVNLPNNQKSVDCGWLAREMPCQVRFLFETS